MKNLVAFLSFIFFFKTFCPVAYSSALDPESEVPAKTVATPQLLQPQTEPLIDADSDPPTRASRLPPRKAKLWIGRSEGVEQAVFSTPLYLGIAFEVGTAFTKLGPIPMALSLGAGWLGGDLVAGIVHMTGDSLDTTKGPKFIRDFAAGFHEHHRDSYRVVQDTFWYQCKGPHMASFLLLGVSEVCRQNGYYAPASALAVTALFSAFSHFIHACSHGRCSDSRVIKFLQDYGIIMSKSRHKKHHSGNYDTHFCITNGYMEPMVRAIYSMGKFIRSGWLKLRGNKDKTP